MPKASPVLRPPPVPEVEPDAPPAPRRIGKGVLTAAVFAAIAVAAVWIWRASTVSQTPVFQFARVERGRIDATVTATGTCNAVVDVLVGSQVSGNIKALYADYNTRVKAGQLVALIDPEMFQARVNQADAALRNSKAALENAKAAAVKAEADVFTARAGAANQEAAIAKAKAEVSDASTKLERRRTLLADRILSQEDFDTAQAMLKQAAADQQAAEAQHEAALHNIQSAEAALIAAGKTVAMFQAEIDLNQAALNQARIDLDHTRITAPVDGTVIARHMDVGQTVAASFQSPTIFEIAQDLTKMQVDTNVAESDIGRLQVGQSASFAVDAYPGLVFTGTVTQIRQAPINVQNVITYDAVIRVANPELKLFPGMTANVTVSTQQSENVLKVPNSALRVKLPASLIEGGPAVRKEQGSNRAVVYGRTANFRAKPIPLRIGISDGTFSEVLEGDVQEGLELIVGATVPGTAPARAGPGAGRF